MKNIHVLPTDKPSRLYLDKGKFWLDDLVYGDNNQNIYITNDEEIKEGDWLLIIDDFETYVHEYKGDNLPTTYYKKIILTTDQDLIKDGVQFIDDEFLEWFVKNPSYEKVEVELIEDSEDHPEIEGYPREEWSYYDIIIPKDESKHTIKKEYVDDQDAYGYNILVKKEPSEETLEEVSKTTQQIIDEDFDGGLTMGQIIPKEEKMYTEQEVLVLLHKRDKHNWDRSLWQTPKEWLNKFKNN
jgi:hypothetical protein